MFNIQTLNPISAKGLSRFNPRRYNVSSEMKDPDALVVRSFNLHAFTIPSSVQVIGRAGVGVNTIPVQHITEMGIPVLNTPGANANAVKELVITAMLLACRNICHAWQYARALEGDNHSLHQQVEQQKKQFAGFELPGKTVGIIGLGNIGVKVANAALSLGMNVIGYDPAITVRHAWELRANVKRAEHLNELLSVADFITLHVPLIDATRHLINTQRLALLKQGAVLLNFARDAIVDEQALLEALNDKLHCYVCDFPSQRLKDHNKVICLPHLGASTREAEENCAMMIADQVQHFLEHGHIENAVNFPTIKMPRNQGYRLAVVNANIPNMVAQISLTLSQANINIIDMINKSKDNIAYTLIDANQTIDQTIIDKLKSIDGVIRVRSIPHSNENMR